MALNMVVDRYDWESLEGLEAKLQALVEAEQKEKEDSNLITHGVAAGDKTKGRRRPFFARIRQFADEFAKKAAK
ncbi:hypothetical protein HDU96_003414 [Phlyctochytrium bullatum]|nr:hypothetical protein HDU96_003414 [Phlyctochytrium bullatum]